MELVEFLEDLHLRYVAQYKALYERKLTEGDHLFPEVTIEVNTDLYKKLYTTDFISKNDEKHGVLELGPTEDAYGTSARLTYGFIEIEFFPTSWDDFQLIADIDFLAVAGFETWFDYWLDLEATRKKPADLFGGVIHSVWIAEPTSICIDFGSAPPDAFLELLDLIGAAGVRQLRVQSSR